MYYVTVRQSPAYHQMTLEELFSPTFNGNCLINTKAGGTRTYATKEINAKLLEHLNVAALIETLEKFNIATAQLRKAERSSLYYSFHIPKKSGGLRRIDAPRDELMKALRELKRIFEEDFGALYHTSAFAYVEKRCTIDAVKKHQQNKSRWFAKLDLHDFFGSTTLDFVLSTFSKIYPFCEVMKIRKGREELETALSLAFLNGGLPQGTPISPLITNIMMIEFDHKLSNELVKFNGQKYVYTRYADDFIISSKYNFDIREITKLVVDSLCKIRAPFQLNTSKTRYGSSTGSGANWNLGVMLNKDNEITVGHKRKRELRCMMHSYIMDKQNGIQWSREDLMIMQGLHSYYRMVNAKDIDEDIVKMLNIKFSTNVLAMIKDDLR